MKIVIISKAEYVAPRFDLATEVTIYSVISGRTKGEPRTVLLPGPSGDDLCGLILKEDANMIVCGGIEEEHYQYLVWKKIKVVDRVIGKTADVLSLALAGNLQAGAIVRGEVDGGSEK
ncbi:MAG: hypothetical protein KKB30_08220 [Proteobacteria bacterium]|nr:hypothetical protein [Pseudomonadota bacterium]MBU1714805.1 hypothetical protein [Pseudomonadota bacterium]